MKSLRQMSDLDNSGFCDADDRCVIFEGKCGTVWYDPSTGNFATMQAGHRLCCELAGEIIALRKKLADITEAVDAAEHELP